MQEVGWTPEAGLLISPKVPAPYGLEAVEVKPEWVLYTETIAISALPSAGR